MKQDSQYQGESSLDWDLHFKYLQSILREFNPAGAPEKLNMIQYFRQGLKPSIRAEIEKHSRELDSFEELVEKTKDAKAKAALRPRLYVKETNQHCL